MYKAPYKSYRNKYGNKKIEINGIVYDSAKEARRHQELLLLERAGAIQNLDRQVGFELIPAQYEYYARYGKTGKRLKDGKRCIEQSVVYKADFVYYENGEKVVEDTKGIRTTDYIIKRKLMLYVHNVRIKEI